MPKSVQSIKATNLLRWAYQTAKRDRKRYRPEERPWTARRVWQSVRPSIRRPLFIIGAPRSGTTFLGDCVAALPEISYHFEPVATKAAARYVYEGAWSYAGARRWYDMTYRWLLRLHGDGDLRFAEKTPRNCFLLSFLRRAFPDAQLVHILRDGRDAALSHSKEPWLQAASAASGKHETGGYAFGPYARFWVEKHRVPEFEHTSDYHRCIWAWRRHVESVLAEAPLIPEAQYHEIRYESFVRDPAAVSNRLLDFLGVTVPDARGRFHAVAERAHTDSIGTWRDELTSEQRRTTEREAGALLRKLGYAEPEVKQR